MIRQHDAHDTRGRCDERALAPGDPVRVEQLEGLEELRLRAGRNNAEPVEQRLPGSARTRHRRRVRRRCQGACSGLTELERHDGLAKHHGFRSRLSEPCHVRSALRKTARQP